MSWYMRSVNVFKHLNFLLVVGRVSKIRIGVLNGDFDSSEPWYTLYGDSVGAPLRTSYWRYRKHNKFEIITSSPSFRIEPPKLLSTYHERCSDIVYRSTLTVKGRVVGRFFYQALSLSGVSQYGLFGITGMS